MKALKIPLTSFSFVQVAIPLTKWNKQDNVALSESISRNLEFLMRLRKLGENKAYRVMIKLYTVILEICLKSLHTIQFKDNVHCYTYT